MCNLSTVTAGCCVPVKCRKEMCVWWVRKGMERRCLPCQVCEENGVVDCYGQIFCLLHYHLLCPHDQNMSSSSHSSSHGVTLISTIDYQEQQKNIELLWKTAISEVVMRMFEYEKLEQQSVQDDPLSILSLNAPRVVPPLPSEKKIPRQRSEELKSSSLRNKKKQRIESNGSSLTTSGEDAPAPVVTEESLTHITGTRCSNCHSLNTYLEYGTNNWSASGRDTMSSKAETWAFKESPSAITENYSFVKNICRDCGFEIMDNI